MAKQSHLITEFLLHLKGLKLPEPVLELRFHPTRKWRFDCAWPDRLLAVEVDGGTGLYGRHNRPQGYENDCEKLNEAIALGWKVLRFTGRQVKSGEAAIFLEERIFAQENG